MAEQRRSGRGPGPDRRSRGGKPSGGKPSGGKSAGGASRGGRPSRGDARGHERRPQEGRPTERRERSEEEQRVFDGPPIPDDVTAKDLDRDVRQALSSLPEKLADRVARHLVMAGALIDDEPTVAHDHALAARARATRVAVVREACGETAYAAGKFAEALAELRAAKRMNGAAAYLPMMADCERALGRPERALAMGTPENREKLDEAGRAELAIVVAGARRDLGQAEAAVRLLERESLHSQARAPWVARLRYAYADALAEAGRREDALEWFHRVLAVDGNGATDATDRVATLESEQG